jgi:hypothetical protein
MVLVSRIIPRMILHAMIKLVYKNFIKHVTKKIRLVRFQWATLLIMNLCKKCVLQTVHGVNIDDRNRTRLRHALTYAGK